MEENKERIQGEGSILAFIVDSNIIFSIIVAVEEPGLIGLSQSIKIWSYSLPV